MQELKPCPFCGNLPMVGSHGKLDELHEVYCEHFACGGEVAGFSSEAEAIECWNTRPLEDALQAEIDKLKAEK